MEFSTYEVKRELGIDDLLNEYAFIGSAQGDTSATNSIEDYKESGGWLTFVFDGIDVTDQQAINNESERRKKHNLEYIERLKREGKYGEEFTINMHFHNMKTFNDERFLNDNQYSSAGIVIPTEKINHNLKTNP